jgi:DNA repair ATPase RecN
MYKIMIEPRIQSFRNAVSLTQEQVKYEAVHIVRLKTKISLLEEEKKQLVKAVGVIDRAITIISANGIGKIESIVSGGLQLIWPELSFVIEKKEGVRGNSYRLLGRKGNITGPLMDTFGGGIVNVVAFLLRVIMLKRFKLYKFLAVDESFNNVSAEYLPAVSEMLQTLCSKHSWTILAITHQPILATAANNVYVVTTGEDQLPRLERVENVSISDSQ